MAEAAGESQAASLREKVAALEAELSACRSRLEREKKRRLQAQACAAKLRRQVRRSGGSSRGGPAALEPFHSGRLLRDWQSLCWGCAAGNPRSRLLVASVEGRRSPVRWILFDSLPGLG